VIAWSKDLGRSIDYLETRPGVDRSRVAYEGVSWGANLGAILPAVEDRIRVCVLLLSTCFFAGANVPLARDTPGAKAARAL